MLTNDKILAHTVRGKNLILLTQVESSYFLVFAQTISHQKSQTIRIIAQRELSYEEMAAIYARMTFRPVASLPGSTTPAGNTANASSEVLFLAVPRSKEAPQPAQPATEPIASPYFPTKDIFLSHQMTGAPNLLK